MAETRNWRPITDEREVHAFLDRVPIVVPRDRFARFVLGFPREYLDVTPPVEIVRHFALAASLGARSSVSSLAREGDRWKLIVLASDRTALFAHIAGSLHAFGANILSAEAFANTEALVLDTFTVVDLGRRLHEPEERRRYQAYLDGVVDGRIDLREALAERVPVRLALGLEWDDATHPTASILRVSGPDAPGLLYAMSRRLSEAGCNIEVAHIDTRDGVVRDAFWLTAGGKKLDAEARARVERALGGAAEEVA
jgi:[protein-PII] uridylyltransferase